MVSRILSLLLLSTLMLSSCTDHEHDESKGNLDLFVKLEYGGEPLVMASDITYPDGKKMFINRVSMYLSELQLTSGQSSVLLSDVGYHDFTASHSTLAKANQGYKVHFHDVTAGNYSGLKFGIGVTPANNAKRPIDFPSSSVLSRNAEYWTSWRSYIFSRIEGQYDSDGDGAVDAGMSLHTGGDEAYLQVSFDRPINIEKGKDNSLVMVIDLKNVFEREGIIYNLDEAPQTHSLSQMPYILQVIENLARAMRLQ